MEDETEELPRPSLGNRVRRGIGVADQSLAERSWDTGGAKIRTHCACVEARSPSGAHSGYSSTSHSTSQTRSTGASTSILVLCSTGPSGSSSLLQTNQDHVPHTSCTCGTKGRSVVADEVGLRPMGRRAGLCDRPAAPRRTASHAGR